MVISLLIYISPITITASLFKRTESMFKQWRTMLMSFTLQPVILFCYLGILITIFDKTMLGDATFHPIEKVGHEKTLNCSTQDAKDNSIYCIFGIMDIGNYDGLEDIGIKIPYLKIGDTGNMGEKVSNVIKAAFLVFIFTSFLDKISTLAKNLTGSSALTSGSKGALSSMLKAKNMAEGVRKRGAGAGTKGIKRAGGAASNVAKKIGEKSARSGSGTSAASQQTDSTGSNADKT
jgi:type IV secretory pathway VirB6-like protein